MGACCCQVRDCMHTICQQASPTEIDSAQAQDRSMGERVQQQHFTHGTLLHNFHTHACFYRYPLFGWKPAGFLPHAYACLLSNPYYTNVIFLHLLYMLTHTHTHKLFFNNLYQFVGWPIPTHAAKQIKGVANNVNILNRQFLTQQRQDRWEMEGCKLPPPTTKSQPQLGEACRSYRSDKVIQHVSHICTYIQIAYSRTTVRSLKWRKH